MGVMLLRYLITVVAVCVMTLALYALLSRCAMVLFVLGWALVNLGPVAFFRALLPFPSRP